ncbi:hypothetical protein MOO44_03875 [Nicoliella spurrieriana]|uniref:ABC-2 type transporter transmembrane domain-containing protein n=1 Tax=Nicoliella spurrieriana TaxID=2925830 RepID=A0A976RSX3_9LACO|nr:ABC transporter permease [Nicoliella spurrieriana]UQS87305.1 hypothetical protein MOO44_03875 [Nicoliella spurrieriana]
MLTFVLITSLNSGNDAMQSNLNQAHYQADSQQSYVTLFKHNTQLIKQAHSNEIANKLTKTNLLLSYLHHSHLKYESTDQPKTSVTLMQKVGVDYMMGIILIAMITILVNLFATNYVENISISTLIPIEKFKFILVNIGVGCLIYGGIILISLLTAMILGLLGGGFGNLNYPINTMLQNQDIGAYVNLSQIIVPLIVIQILFIIFMVMFSYLIVSILKDKLNSLLFVNIITFGALIGIYFFKPISSLAHLIPFSFYNGFNIATFQLGTNINNDYLTATDGMVILSSSIVVMLLMIIGTSIIEAHNKNK